jgi:hypothetical protein
MEWREWRDEMGRGRREGWREWQGGKGREGREGRKEWREDGRRKEWGGGRREERGGMEEWGGDQREWEGRKRREGGREWGKKGWGRWREWGGGRVPLSLPSLLDPLPTSLLFSSPNFFPPFPSLSHSRFLPPPPRSFGEGNGIRIEEILGRMG